MNILGIETSCDETAASIVKDGRKILSNIVATSVEMHTKTGGIIPEKAAREQIRSILPVVQNAMLNAKCQISNIDAVAITVGPGLIGSLLVGVETAKTLALLWEKPIIPVNHLVAHIYANWLAPEQEGKRVKEYKLPKFPALALVVSGGHTDLVLMKGRGKLKWIGGTRDDAAGEAFDKSARLLGLPYPGGPSISKEAAKFLSKNPKTKLTLFPRPIIDEQNFDWSFSGLKTAVLRETQKLDSKLIPLIPKLAAEVQEAIVDVLVEKTLRAVKKFKPESLLLAGGVAANSRLREKFQLSIINSQFSIDFRVPPPPLCTDNAAYIAAYAYYNNSPIPWERVAVNPELTIASQP
ncbi:tRNA (adenosine(37)-N6)-threonylcarbamoyltransferase complex transferase subunit TsaD [Candidatus Woesebacteria bacterium RBG_19FT_COMBO_42_9]|uniref:tRNA N6-adenosine threonylcarbamoyltransferase n=1 Tax=Candidatus Woesebacteria bacterium RBG_16_42_24 TaxID=1802485 RepID=A0A1F7XL80_9BACT|nr:MAG: tRNA (adenosine(37)-N6)-threonylcarbamoyltransferase complex transferase subunit TsaD [Candidatus Woesebacteria bacterium RBG_16_42_24]OGM17645.1 MAG: tRNA (adenosine(37)-N6)-threonylcarbamoyltransferase complex transferase subunit TsaD [Candidatus Woesebacteria bacterium RBG_19FT_COMBO_42_9]OGM68259.1 MAG: tRNA (adenosine(37)-N6)-threonylcarbamoyltransferase complex transferase subunit TsaD [Candidatus Woesebacteria bacterium RIFCSPLOWO2_01_FULL_43_11]